MADLRNADRGQLFLVMALAIGVTSIALILLLNGAIYTQNVSSRALGADDRQAIGETETFIEGAEGLLVAENDREYDTKAVVYRNVSSGIEKIEELQRRHNLKRGVYTGTTGLTLSNGTTLNQDAEATFTSSGNKLTWDMATDVYGIRNGTIVIESAKETSDPINESFVFQISGKNTDWNLSVFDNTTSGLNISTETDGSYDPVCSDAYTSNPVTITLTNASINGSTCSDIAYWNEVSEPYDIKILRGENVTGTYSLTINNSTSVSDFNLPGGQDPYMVPVVYSVSGTYEYQSSSLNYTKTFRLAPGEPNG